MPVPKFACEVSNAFRFVWTMGGEGEISRKKHCESVIRPYFHQEGKFRNTHARIKMLNDVLDKNMEPMYKPNPIKNYVYHTLVGTSKSEFVLGFKAKIPLKMSITYLAQEIQTN